jgi:hypothetical protein
MSARLPVLGFHDFDDGGSVISFPPGLFERALTRLTDRGYRTIGLLDAAHRIAQRQPFPERTFVITIDDGYRAVYEVAFPIIQRLGLSATVFLTVGRALRPDLDARLPDLEGRTMLSWPEIREMHDGGMEFGAHTLTHPYLNRIPTEDARVEISQSKAAIEETLGAEVRSFCYPFGYVDSRTRDVVARQFDCACGGHSLGLVTARSDVYALKRVDAYYLRSDLLFGLIATPMFPFYVAARQVPRGARHLVTSLWQKGR